MKVDVGPQDSPAAGMARQRNAVLHRSTVGSGVMERWRPLSGTLCDLEELIDWALMVHRRRTRGVK